MNIWKTIIYESFSQINSFISVLPSSVAIEPGLATHFYRNTQLSMFSVHNKIRSRRKDMAQAGIRLQSIFTFLVIEFNSARPNLCLYAHMQFLTFSRNET